METKTPPKFCPYCGRRVHNNARACSAHKDLPKLDPVYLVKKGSRV